MENHKRMENKNEARKTVRFCVHVRGNQCNNCETSRSKDLNQITAFHQIQTDITCFFSKDSSSMIADLGCPNTVISQMDEKVFIQSLSKFQQKNLKRVKTDEKFKFGPS